jgi:nucleoside phosphorylase
VLGVVTGLKSEAKLLKGLKLACVSTGGQAGEARRKIDRLIADDVTGLVSLGIAGALSPDLKAGDLVISDTVIGESGKRWQVHRPWVDSVLFEAGTGGTDRRDNDAPHHAAARRSEGHATSAPFWSPRDDLSEETPPPPSASSSVTSAVRPGRQTLAEGGVGVGGILGLDHMLSSPRDKAQAFAQRGALCVDMESHHVARAAAERGLPFIAIRTVSDEAHEALPAVMASFVDAEGRTKMSAVLAALIFRRVKLGELLQAGAASRRAHQALLRCRRALAGLR